MCNKGITSGMRPSGQYLKAAFTGLVIGFVFSFLLGRSVWLEMRVNIGHAIPVFLAISVFSFVLRRRPVRLASFLFLEALAVVLVFILYGFSFSTVLIVPAALFRDGFHLGFMSLQGINRFLLCSLGTVNVCWICATVMVWRRNGAIHRPATGQASVQDRKYVLERRSHG
jgi:hypothetical protein